MSKSSYKIAATDLRSFESDRRQGLFFLLSIFFITIHDCMYVCSTYSSLYACTIRKKRPSIKTEIRKVLLGTGSYFQSTAPQSRVLTTRPWGQRDLELNLMRQIRICKTKVLVKLWSLPDTAHCVMEGCCNRPPPPLRR
jgi:hypothetical protein